MRRGVDRGGQHIGLHHHAGAAARRRVIDGAMPVVRRIADVAHIERPEAAVERLAGERGAERPRKHLRETG